MGLRMKNMKIFVVHWKIGFLGGIHEKKQYRGGNCPKSGGLDILQF